MRPIAFAALTTLLLVGCVDRAAQEQAKQTEKVVSDPARSVVIQPARQETIVERIEITGDLTTAEDTQVGAKVPGRIVTVYVKDGDTVAAGQLLATQDASSLIAQVQAAQAQAMSAQSGVLAAQSALSQATSNARVGPSRTSAEVRRAEAAVRSARSQLRKALAGARTEERTQAEWAVRNARQNMETARKELDRVRRLVNEGAIPRSRLDQAENAFMAAQTQHEAAVQSQLMLTRGNREEDISTAREAVRQAEEALQQAKAGKRLDVLLVDAVNTARAQLQTARAQAQAAQAQVRIAQQALSDAQIRAPFSGRVAGKPVQPGTVVGAGAPILRLVGAGGVYFEGQIPEASVARITPGKPVQVTVAALPGRSFAGRVAAVSPVGDSVGRLFTARVTLASGLGEVRPGMFARGQVEVRRVPNATVVPAGAVLGQGAEEKAVFVVEGTKAKRYAVKLGITQGNLVQVIGLPVGARVVVQGQEGLQEGSLVKVEGAPAGAAPAAPVADARGS